MRSGNREAASPAHSERRQSSGFRGRLWIRRSPPSESINPVSRPNHAQQSLLNPSAFSAIFSEKSAFSGSVVIASGRKYFQFNELIDGIPIAQSLVEVTGDAKARTTF